MNENWLSVFLIITMLIMMTVLSLLSRTVSDLRAENDRLTQQLCQYKNGPGCIGETNG